MKTLPSGCSPDRAAKSKRNRRAFAALIAIELAAMGAMVHAAGLSGYARMSVANYACGLEDIDYQPPKPHVHDHVAEFEVGGETYVVERTTTTYTRRGTWQGLCDDLKDVSPP